MNKQTLRFTVIDGVNPIIMEEDDLRMGINSCAKRLNEYYEEIERLKAKQYEYIEIINNTLSSCQIASVAACWEENPYGTFDPPWPKIPNISEYIKICFSSLHCKYTRQCEQYYEIKKQLESIKETINKIKTND